MSNNTRFYAQPKCLAKSNNPIICIIFFFKEFTVNYTIMS